MLRNAVDTAQNGVVAQLQTAVGRVAGYLDLAHGALGQRAERAAAGIERLPVEAALVDGQREVGQLAHLGKRVVVDAAGPHRPVAGTRAAVLQPLVAPFGELLAELLSRAFGEDLVQTVAQTVEAHGPDGVALVHPHAVLGVAGLEVHEDLVFGYARGHELAVAAQYVATVGLHAHAVALHA